MSWACDDVDCAVRKENIYFDTYNSCLNDAVDDDDGVDVDDHC